ncbi:MAG: cyclic nucleotide-binding domain-containing protein [Gammaproteobacteria bacterium]
MAVDINSEEARIIRQLIPLSNLPYNQFVSLCDSLQIETAEQGEVLFGRGDDDSALYFLVDGSIDLKTEAFVVETIKAGSDSARFAIAHQIPRKIDAVATSKIHFLRLNAAMIKAEHETPYQEIESTMMVDEPGDEEDWMTMLLRSPIFRSLPPANLQRILISLEEAEFPAGETIIRQGDAGDYYYIIKKGKVLISRKPSANAREIKLAQLGDMDTFGEDSLISGEPRNVSVTALTEVTVLRLGKENFINLIKKPTLKYIGSDELQGYVNSGAELIDVREPDEFRKHHLPHSVNVPFFSLRMHLKTLDRRRPVVVVCRDGRASESAAFILQRFKFDALVLKGGMAGVKLIRTESESKPASFAIDDGTETSNLVEVTSELASQEVGEDSHEALPEEASDLTELVLQLKAKCAALEAEKMTLELKCASLVRQLEKLKAELIKAKSGG